METVPCALCGYHAPEAACPHCHLAPRERTLAAAPARGPAAVWAGLGAVPRGLAYLARTPGTKRWLVPPLLVTLAILAAALTATLRWIAGWRDAHVPTELDWRRVDWLDPFADGWSWLHTVLLWLVVAAEWLAELVLGALASGPFAWLAGFLIASLVVWYCFSIAYEAVAGPFLDEIQGRFEERWFGADPRSSLSRPNDLPVRTCAVWTAATGAGAAAAVAAVLLSPLAWPWVVPAALLPWLAAGLVHRRYGEWLLWVARIEGGALWVGIQASLVTALLLVIALPLYLVPGIGYFLYAGVTGFATAVALLDIATERRGWSVRQRLRFVGRNGPPLVAFGVVSGLLLTLPVVGPLLMVPGASVGGLWLLCRLDKNFLRRGAPPMEFSGTPGTVARR